MTPTSAFSLFFFFNDTATTEIYTLSLHDALPIFYGAATMLRESGEHPVILREAVTSPGGTTISAIRELEKHGVRSEEHTSELQSRLHLVCRLLLEKKKKNKSNSIVCNAVHELV